VTTLNNIKTRLAAIAATVSGIQRTYAEAPASLPDADLPILIPFAGPATFIKIAETLGEETRTFQLRLYVVHKQAGYPGEAEKTVEPFLTSVRDVFLAHPMLGLGQNAQLAFIEKSTFLGDSGIVVLPFAGEDYVGTEYKIAVTSITPITIAAFE